jgi:hypothetical protein
MRRALVALGFLLSLTACSNPEAVPDAAASPAPSARSSQVVLGTRDACATADLTYLALGADEQRTIAAGRAAEAKGDTAGVKAALDKLEPRFKGVSATYADLAGKVADPEFKAALTSLAAASAKAAEFTTFAEFQSLAALTAPAETTLKRVCADAGYTMVNLD